jgi:putative ABC transport system permease protein
MLHPFRRLLASPGFTITALVTLALGIGVNTTAFSLLNTLLLHTPPYPQPDALVRVVRTTPQGQSGVHSAANFLDYRAQNTVFEHMAAIRSTDFNVGAPGQPAERLRGLFVTADYFPLLRTAPLLGRTFTPEEDRVGNNNVAIISHATWTQRFGGDPAVVGRTLRIDGTPVTIIGVMPATFADPQLWGEVAAWRPLALPDVGSADRENSSLTVAARLKPGLTLDQAQTAMSALSAQLALAYPATNLNRGLRLVPLGRSTQDNTGRGITWLVAGLAGFVLLIACANLANLQFARNAARGREHAIRIALGASRAQLIRLVLTECVLLSLIGGALGLVLALWSNELVSRSFTFGESAGLVIPLDRRVLAFTFVVSVLTGVGFGLFPAWLASRANVGDALKQGSRGSTAGRAPHRVRHALIVGEIALALVLLAGAGFFLHGLQRFTQRDPGWRTEGLLTAEVSLRGQHYDTSAARDAFYRRLHERLAAIPGVERAAIGTSLPTSGYNLGNSFVVEGQPPPAPGRNLTASVSAVSPGYFDTLGIRLLQGRDFTAADANGKPYVVVINESMARQLWPGQNPIGKRIGGATPFMENPREIIGVVSDVRSVASLNNVEGGFQFYRALAQWNQSFATIALRSRTAPETLAPALRRAVAEIDPDQAVFRVNTVQHEIDRGLGPVDAAGYTLAGFAALGVLLAAVGIYGVIANSVVQRTNEIGIRMALGAQVRDIFALILGGGLRLTLMGILLGLAGAFGVARLLPVINPELSAANAGVTTGVTVFLILIAALACWLPARRATRVDPMTALRAE